jgi:hypothetical protein
MAISVFPAPVTSSLNANAITAAAANTVYQATLVFDPAIYTITCASGTITNFQLWNGSTLVLSSVTASGTVAINLASAADRIRLWTNTGTNVVVTITKTASALTDNWSGTLDTITTLGSSTYTGTSTSGKAYAVLVGGGGGGGKRFNGAQGGGSGAVCTKLVTLTGSMAVVIGAGGAGTTTLNANGTSGGSSTFDGMTAGGGAGGAITGGGVDTPVASGTATGGDFNSNGAPTTFTPFGNVGTSTTTNYPFIAAPGTTGAGGFGLSGDGGLGGGSGIGTGGRGGSSNTSTNGANGTGYGSGGGGGGGGASVATNGGNGAQGVLYVLKF